MKTDWPHVAELLAARIPHEALHPGAMQTAWVEAEVCGQGLFTPRPELQARRGRRAPPSKLRGGGTPPTSMRPANENASRAWAVALSGGADSLALLLLLWAHGPGRWGRKFVALHFNHRLRGRAADADEKFCVGVCAALGVRIVAGRWRGNHQGASEAEARAARFAWMERAQKRRRTPVLWLGHQQDDIAESLFMRLARGSGTAGLAAPRPAQPMPGGRWHLRPLLAFKKLEIVAALRAAGATWREDASNTGEDFFRNRIRRSVLPAWRRAAAGRDALAGAALARERLEEDDMALEAWVDNICGKMGDREPGLVARATPKGRSKTSPRHGRAPVTLNLVALAGVPRAVVRRALHRWLLVQPDTGDLARQGFEQLLAAVERGSATRFSLGRAGFAVIRRGQLVYEPARRGNQRRR